ncbi:MAG: hypothetical protein Q4E46_02135 [Candidatus Saccharibacteria bacterium]|nr:hypothetical protein [Candidatus Saccharibacteria bacterium]
MNQNYGNSKTQNLRFIIVTVLVGLVILGIAVWAITFVIGNFSKKPAVSVDEDKTATSSVSASSDSSAMPSPVANPSDTPTSTTTPSTTPSTTENAVVTTPPAVTVSSVPETGPEDILPFALVAGTSVAYVTSKKVRA